MPPWSPYIQLKVNSKAFNLINSKANSQKLLCLPGPPTCTWSFIQKLLEKGNLMEGVNSQVLPVAVSAHVVRVRLQLILMYNSFGLNHTMHNFHSCCASPSAMHWVQKVQWAMMFVDDQVATKKDFLESVCNALASKSSMWQRSVPTKEDLLTSSTSCSAGKAGSKLANAEKASANVMSSVVESWYFLFMFVYMLACI